MASSRTSAVLRGTGVPARAYSSWRGRPSPFRLPASASALLVLHLCLLSSLSRPVQGACSVTSQRCDFPFTYEGQESSSCIPHNATAGEDGDDDQFVCITQMGQDKWGWNVCGEGCLDNTNQPLYFGGDMRTAAVFCKVKPVECVFPFTYDGQTYEECTEEGGMDFAWCATKVDEQGVMVPNFWGKCDRKTCLDEDLGPMVAEVKFEGAEVEAAEDGAEANPGVQGELQLEQDNPFSPLTIKGKLTGLPPGLHGFHVHELENDGGNCTAAGPHFNPFGVDHGAPDSETRHVGDFGNIEADSEGVALIDLAVSHASIFEGEDNSILQRTLVIHADADDLGQAANDEAADADAAAESRATGNAGPRLACAVVRTSSEWDLTLIIIIVLIVLIVILAILIICLICYYCKKRRGKHSKVSRDDPDHPYANGGGGGGGPANGKKVPLYDELSIPFIDASPAPTPKTGRSTEKLSFFHRSSSVGRSRGSLSSVEK